MSRSHFPGVPLRTERLQLRPYRDSDTEAVFEIRSDPRVMRFWSTPPLTDLEQAREIVSRDIAFFEAGECLALGLERISDGQLIGQCVLFRLDRVCRRAEIGYGLASRAWGQGYMNEALRALVRYGFEQMNLNRIEADIDPLNKASAKTLERLGFRKEGLLRERWIVDGTVSDSEMYGLLRKEWQDSSGS